ncbi:MAG: 50S ribosomal protein L9 [Clostridia bacterium]|nr:50S ribosomal protein L9 [Clostridia bacterium]
MKVILLSEVKGLGGPGKVAEVADGYARNYLIPRGLATPATEAALREKEASDRRRTARERREREEARALALRLRDLVLRVPARAGEGGRLFGSVTAQDVARHLAQAAGVEVDRRRIELPGPIKTVGRHVVRVRLHPEVVAELVVAVEGAEGA